MHGASGPQRSGAPGELPGDLEALEAELHSLTQEHARLRWEIEQGFTRIRYIEERFLSLRPQADAETQRQLKHRMVLSRPWREELEHAYQDLLNCIQQIGTVTRRIHEVQLRAAQVAARSGGPTLERRPSPS